MSDPTQRSQEEVDAKIKAFADSEHDRLTKDSIDTLRDIENNLMGDVTQIPLQVFTEVFKPYFDIAVDLDVKQAEELFDMWVSKVCNGNATSPVQIVDENGTPLVVVPALINTKGFSISDANITDLAQGIHKHGMEKISTPELADSELDKVLERTLIKTEDTSEIGEQWLSFYEYFGLPISVDDNGEYTYAVDYLRLKGLIGDDGKRFTPEVIAEKAAVAEANASAIADTEDFMDAMFGD